ncbi:uncharacterized protein [Diadema antillarum]|uniref:uncharacterized protein n=1 Tax=Diadema antillarum TaxID=105358 RepID=UPI003A8C3155
MSALHLLQENTDVRRIDSTTAEILLEHFTRSMINCSLKLPHSFPSKKNIGKPEWSSKLQSSFDKAHCAWKTWQRGNGEKEGTLYDNHIEQKKSFRRSLRQARARQKNSLMKEIESASTVNQALFYRLIKGNRDTSCNERETTSLSHAGITYTDGEVLIGWHKYFADLAHDPASSLTQIESRATQPYNNCLEPSNKREWQLNSRELNEAIGRLKTGRASGADNISPEHFKNLGIGARRLLLTVLNAIIRCGLCPRSLKERIILPFHKGKGKDTMNPKNY